MADTWFWKNDLEHGYTIKCVYNILEQKRGYNRKKIYKNEGILMLIF